MVSERRLAERMESYWSELTPHLGVEVRRLNFSGHEQLFAPLTSTVAPKRMFLVSEVGYAALSSTYPTRPSKATVAAMAATNADKIIERFVDRTDEEVHSANLSAEEIDLALSLADRIFQYLRLRHSTADVTFGYGLPGLGFVSEVEVDAVSSATLFEFKATERPLTSADLRQVLIYLTLSRFAKRNIASVELFNARRGRLHSVAVDDLLFSASGVAPIEFYHRCRDMLERLLFEEQR